MDLSYRKCLRIFIHPEMLKHHDISNAIPNSCHFYGYENSASTLFNFSGNIYTYITV